MSFDNSLDSLDLYENEILDEEVDSIGTNSYTLPGHFGWYLSSYSQPTKSELNNQ